MDELTLGDKIYISSKRAAEITGYAKDYVGQLCREGHVEAKMVGRSWYVLESSIREHRFGKSDALEKAARVAEEAEKAEELAKDTMIDVLSTWEAPRYLAEEPTTLPPVDVPPKVEAPVASPKTVQESTEAISDMQAAWKEWFERKEPIQEPRIESPEVIDARAAEEREEEEQVIPVHKLEEPKPQAVPEVEREEGAVSLPIRSIRRPAQSFIPATSGRVIEERIVRRAGSRPVTRRANVIQIALLASVALIAIAVGVIGTGHADAYIDKNPILKFLGGASTISNQ